MINKKIIYLILSIVLIAVIYFKFIRPETRNYRTGYSGIAIYSNGVDFIQWTEIHNKLTGQLTETVLNNDKIHSENLSFTGIRSKNRITLSFKYFFLFNKKMTGRIRGNEFTLNMPTSTSITPVVFKYSHISRYYKLIAKFKKIAYKRKQNITSVHKYNQKLKKINDDIVDFTSNMKNTGIPNNIMFLKNYLTDEQNDLNTMKRNFILELQNIKDANNTRSCYELVNVAGYDYKSLIKYDYYSLIMRDKNLFNSGEHNIENKFINAELSINKTRLLIQKLKNLEKSDKYPLPKSTSFYKFISPRQAYHDIDAYQSIAANAKNLLPKLEARNERNIEYAKVILEKGGNAYKKSLSLTHCR